jgi:peptidoglycan hydrolase CwlO-like protein
MLNAAKEAQKPLEDDVRALKDDITTLKTLKKETEAQNIQLQEKLGQEVETHNCKVEGLKENLSAQGRDRDSKGPASQATG